MNNLGLWKVIPFIFLYVAGWIILPFVLLFVPKEQEYLPGPFRMWDNFSGPGKDGLAGDHPYRVSKGMGSKILDIDGGPFWADGIYVQTCSKYKLYWRRYVWLAWRNPADYSKAVLFGKVLLSTPIDVQETITWRGAPSPYGIDNDTAPGTRRLSTAIPTPGLKTEVIKEVYFVSRPYFGYYTRARFGYKIRHNDVAYQSTHPELDKYIVIRWEFSGWFLNKL